MSQADRIFDYREGTGVTVGKFMPLHKGHELMIEMGAAEFTKMVVIVSDEMGMPVNRKMPSLQERYEIIRAKYSGVHNIHVVKHVDDYGPAREYDEKGTAVDEDFWKYWIKVFNDAAPDATHVVSSDHYGGVMAERLGIKWLPVDPKRELFLVSGTAIRKDPIANWKFISKEFRPFFAKKIVVIGAESSGKSTLVNDLGEWFNSPSVPEYGRILSEVKPDLSMADFYSIVRRQEFMTNKAAMESETGLVFVDTEKLVTWMYGKIYLKEDLRYIRERVTPDEFDLWVVVMPNLPWVDDGTRILSDLSEREKFVAKLIIMTTNSQIRHLHDPVFNRIILGETDRKRRVEIVGEHVAELLGHESNLAFDKLSQPC